MALRRSQKEGVVKGIAERFQGAQGVILTEYSGLKVSQLTELRREIKKVQGDFRVLKNRLVKRALAESDMKGLVEYFKGPIGVAFSSSDPVALTKVIAKYVESFEALKLKVGFVAGKVVNAKELQQISKLPSKEELYAKLLGTLQAPIQGLLRAMQGVPQKLVIALSGIKDKKQAEASHN